MWRAIGKVHPDVLQNVIAPWPGKLPHHSLKDGIVYSAEQVVAVSKLPCTLDQPVPAPSPGRLIVFVPFGLNIVNMLQSPLPLQVRPLLASLGGWWDTLSGYWEVLLEVPGSRDHSYEQQCAMLSDGFEPAPVLVVAFALAVHLSLSSTDLISHHSLRCFEEILDDQRAGVSVMGKGCAARVFIDPYIDGAKDHGLFLAAARRLKVA